MGSLRDYYNRLDQQETRRDSNPRKTFGMVSHDTLPHKVYNYGIYGAIYEWFKSYLHDLHQLMMITNAKYNLAVFRKDQFWVVFFSL